MSDYFDASTNRVTPGTTARANDLNQLRDDTGAAFDALPLLASVTNSTINYGTVGGTPNGITLTMELTPTSYADGYLIAFKASANNTGAVTIDVDSLGAKSLVTADGTALVADSLVANYIYQARYNSTSGKFELQRLLVTTLDLKIDYAEEWANKAEDSLVSTAAGGDGVDDYSALHHAAKAATSASNASTSASNASTSETNAATSETNAATSETNAAASAAAAAASAASVSSWTYSSTAINATASDMEHVTVTAATKTITLPLSPAEGTRVRIGVGNFEDTTIGRNGQTIWGVADDRTINKAYATVECVFNNSNWEVM